MREAVEWARSKIFNNDSIDGTSDTIPDLSMPSPMSEPFNEKKTRMMGI